MTKDREKLLDAIALAGAEKERRLACHDGFYWRSESAILRQVMKDLGCPDFVERYTPEMRDLIERMIGFRCKLGPTTVCIQ